MDEINQKITGHLVLNLKGIVTEALSQLNRETICSYKWLVQGVESKYETKHQDRVSTARYKTRSRRGEYLQMLAQDRQDIVHQVCPRANPDILILLLQGQFIDVLHMYQFKIHVALQETLAIGMKFKSYGKSNFLKIL